MPRPRSLYTKHIIEALECTEEKAHEVETVMRDMVGTLDHLKRDELQDLARRAAKEVRT